MQQETQIKPLESCTVYEKLNGYYSYLTDRIITSFENNNAVIVCGQYGIGKSTVLCQHINNVNLPPGSVKYFKEVYLVTDSKNQTEAGICIYDECQKLNCAEELSTENLLNKINLSNKNIFIIPHSPSELETRDSKMIELYTKLAERGVNADFILIDEEDILVGTKELAELTAQRLTNADIHLSHEAIGVLADILPSNLRLYLGFFCSYCVEKFPEGGTINGSCMFELLQRFVANESLNNFHDHLTLKQTESLKQRVDPLSMSTI